MTSAFDGRPIVVAVAGPDGAGKTTFVGAHLALAALRFVNADELARDLDVPAYAGAEVATKIREALLAERESFVFETVFSDPVGDKLAFLRRTDALGYTVVLCFIGLASPELSEERVAMRVLQGGHDVATEKLLARFGRTLGNLRLAIRQLPHVLVFDNSDLAHPFGLVAEFDHGKALALAATLPDWLPWRRPRRAR